MKTSNYFDSKDTADTVTQISNWLAHDLSVEKALDKHRRIKVTVEKAESKRSLAANNFYWVIVTEFTKQIWPDYSKEMVHYTLGEAFRSTRKPQQVIDVEIKEGRHKTEWFIPSTTKDNTFEFWHYVEQVLNAFFEAQGELTPSDFKDYQEIKRMYKG